MVRSNRNPSNKKEEELKEGADDYSDVEFESELTDKSFTSNNSAPFSSTGSRSLDRSLLSSTASNIPTNSSLSSSNYKYSNNCTKHNFADRTASTFHEWTRSLPAVTTAITMILFIGILCFFLFHTLFNPLTVQEGRRRSPATIQNNRLLKGAAVNTMNEKIEINSENSNLGGHSQPMLASISNRNYIPENQGTSTSPNNRYGLVSAGSFLNEKANVADLLSGDDYVRKVRQSLQETESDTDDDEDIYDAIQKRDPGIKKSLFERKNIKHYGLIFNSSTTFLNKSDAVIDFGSDTRSETSSGDEISNHYLLRGNHCLIPNFFKKVSKSKKPLVKYQHTCASQKTSGVVNRKDCCYQIIKGEIHKGNEDFWKTLVCTPLDLEDKDSVSVLEKSEFVRIRCKTEPFSSSSVVAANTIEWTQNDAFTDSEFRAHVPLKSKLVRNKIQYWIDQENNSKLKPQPMSVLILGLDSISRQTFHQSLPLTKQLLLKTMNFVDMKGHHILGSKKLDNIIPLLLGIEKYELSSSSGCNHRWKSFWDSNSNGNNEDCPFIWTKYSDANYVTMYAEDLPDTFNYGNQGGFKVKPTDYYLRPLLLEKQRYERNSSNYCFGNETTSQMILNYLAKFTIKFNSFDTPSFSFTFINGNENWLQNPETTNGRLTELDSELHNCFKKLLFEETILNNTLFILLSSEGRQTGSLRTNGLNGFLDHRLPLLLIRAPPHLAIDEIIESNSFEITTPLDIHATLEFILKQSFPKTQLISKSMKLKPASKTKTSKRKGTKIMARKNCGLSLFSKLPENRTCAQSCIDLHWCTCNVSVNLGLENQMEFNAPNQKQVQESNSNFEVLSHFIHTSGILNTIMTKLNEMARLQKQSLLIGRSRSNHCPKIIFKRLLYLGYHTSSWDQNLNISSLNSAKNIIFFTSGSEFLLVGVEVEPKSVQYEVFLQKERFQWVVVPPIIRVDSSKGYTFCINLNKNV